MRVRIVLRAYIFHFQAVAAFRAAFEGAVARHLLVSEGGVRKGLEVWGCVGFVCWEDFGEEDLGGVWEEGRVRLARL